jgi:hypothetical protein
MHLGYADFLRYGRARIVVDPDAGERLRRIACLYPDTGEVIAAPSKGSNDDSGHDFLLPDTRMASLDTRSVNSQKCVRTLAQEGWVEPLACSVLLTHSCMARSVRSKLEALHTGSQLFVTAQEKHSSIVEVLAQFRYS